MKSVHPQRILCVSRARRLVRAATVLLAMLAGGAVSAQPLELYWDLNGADPGASGTTTAAGTWNAANLNWNTDSSGGGGGTISAWQAGEVAVFSAGTNATGSFTVAVSGTQTIGGLRFEEGVVTLSGGVLQFSDGATFTHNATAGDCPINSAVQGNGVLNLDGAGNWARLNGIVSDSGGTLSVELESGNWIFGGQHTYTGGTIINSYAVSMLSSTGSASAGDLTSGPFGTGTLVLKSGTLRPTLNTAITTGNAITLDGNFNLGVSGNTGPLIFTGPLELTGTRTLTTTGSNVYFNGVLGDGGNDYGFTKSGTSALVLGGDNTFTGPVTIENGTVTLANAGALNSAAPVPVIFDSNANTKTLQLAGHSVTVAGLSTGSTVGTSIVENNAAGTATLTVNNASPNTFRGVLQNGAAGTLALTKTGAGTLTLSGSSSNTYTGLTTVSGGGLHLEKSSGNAVGGNLTISGGAKVTFGGSQQIADGAAVTMSGANSVFNGTGINAGQLHNIQETIASLTVTGGAFNAGNAATWNIIGAGTFSGGAGGTVFVGNSGVGTTLSFGSLSLTAMTATAEGSVTRPNSFTLYGNSTSTMNTIIVGSEGLALDGSRFNLRRGNTTGALGSRLVLDGNVTTAGTSASSILEDTSGGTIGSIAVELSSTGGDVTRTFSISGGGANLTVSVPIINGAATSAGITKTGAGTLTLSGTNTYTGGTTISGGTLQLGADNVLADAGTVTVSGGTLDINTRTDTIGDFSLTSGSVTGTTGVLTASSYAVQSGTIGAALGGSGGLAKTGGGTVILSGTTANTYAGLTTVSAGTLALNKTPGANAIAGHIVVNGGTLGLAANHQIADTSDITVNGTANFNSNDKTETVRNVMLNSSFSTPLQHRVANMNITETLTVTKGVVGLTSSTTTSAKTVSMSGNSRMDMAANIGDTIFNIGSGGLTMSGATFRFGWTGLDSDETARVNLGGDFTGSGTNALDYLTLKAPRLLDLQDNTRTFNIIDGTTTISPTIQNGGLAKTGAGTLILNGDNAYAGLTTVDAGRLLVHGTHAGGGAYTVSNNGTLGGTGTIDAAVGVGTGGRLAPGASVGTLAIVGNLTLDDGSTFQWEFNSDNATADLLNLDGNLDLLGNVSLDLVDETTPGSALAVGTKFTVISYSGDWNGGIFDDYANYGTFTSGLNEWRIRYNDGDFGLNGGLYDRFLTLTVVPEPSSVLLLLGALLGLLHSRPRRR